MRGLSGLRFIIAGGATGVGEAVARRLGEEGARIVVGDINIKGAQKVAHEVTAASNGTGHAIAVEFDLGDERSINTLIQKTVDEYGGIDGLVNIGAALGNDVAGKDLNLVEMDPAIWRKTFDVNLLGYALTTKAVLPHLIAGGNGGSIVNISSGSTWEGFPGLLAYQVCKAGLHALTRYTANQYGPDNVRVNCVAFGAIGTDCMRSMIADEDLAQRAAATPLRRVAEPHEPAALISYLLSNDSSFITGQVWSCCGGKYLRE